MKTKNAFIGLAGLGFGALLAAVKMTAKKSENNRPKNPVIPSPMMGEIIDAMNEYQKKHPTENVSFDDFWPVRKVGK